MVLGRGGTTSPESILGGAYGQVCDQLIRWDPRPQFTDRRATARTSHFSPYPDDSRSLEQTHRTRPESYPWPRHRAAPVVCPRSRIEVVRMATATLPRHD